MMLVLALSALAASPAPAPAAPATVKAPAPAAPLTLQQRFDAASNAASNDECEKAIPQFEALERSPAVKPGSFVAAAIAVRKGQCLVHTGHAEQGEAALLAGLPQVERAGSDFAIDTTDAYLKLGEAAMTRWDYAEAQRRFLAAYTLGIPEFRLRALAGLIRSGSFDAASPALKYADEAIALAGQPPKPEKMLLATLYALKGRVQLNRGQTVEAYETLRKALAYSGGLTLTASLSQVSLRGDLAVAAMLLGNKDEARKYLAYTGAGRITKSPFATATLMRAPECGASSGLRPEDFAVVEFGIAPDGSVSNAQTIYSRSGPASAATFAAAVSDWYWKPEELAKIPPFYRLATRVELRCSQAGGKTPNALTPLFGRFTDWAETVLGPVDQQSEHRSETIAALNGKLATATAAGDATAQIAAIGALTIIDPRPDAARLERALGLASTARLPAQAHVTLRVLRLLTPSDSSEGRSRKRAHEITPAQLTALANDPAVAGDALAADSLLVLDPEMPSPTLQQVADDNRLPAVHPLRQLALLRLANRAAQDGNLAAAQALFARTGLTEQQCAVIGAQPAMRRSGATSADYPKEAMYYGFEGWVSLEFDITANGRVAGARPIVAYPPFVFADAATQMTRDIHYEASYRPGGSVACSANQQNIQFAMPEQH